MLDVVVFAAHPDDAEAACGGLLVKLARLGHRTAICDLTRGEMASNGTPETRAREAQEAARVLGLVERLQLGLPDSGLDGRDRRQVEALVRVLRAHAPRLVVAPPASSRHPDHRETSALVRRAHFYCAVRGFLPEVPPVVRPVRLRCLDWGTMRPSFVVDITAELPTKIAALRCYRSQFERSPGDHPTVLNDAAWIERVEIHARHYGRLAGIAAGEPYTTDAPLAVHDPLALFAAGPEVRP